MLVTRFWYIRSVNPQNAMVTGLTRDGVWLIEKGKIVHPVNNFRFNDSPVNLLKNLEATSVADPGRQRVLLDHRPGDPGPRLPLHLEERRGLSPGSAARYSTPATLELAKPLQSDQFSEVMRGILPIENLGPSESVGGPVSRRI